MNPREKSHTTSVFDIGFITRGCYFHTLLGIGRLARSLDPEIKVLMKMVSSAIFGRFTMTFDIR